MTKQHALEYVIGLFSFYFRCEEFCHLYIRRVSVISLKIFWDSCFCKGNPFLPPQICEAYVHIASSINICLISVQILILMMMTVISVNCFHFDVCIDIWNLNYPISSSQVKKHFIHRYNTFPMLEDSSFTLN